MIKKLLLSLLLAVGSSGDLLLEAQNSDQHIFMENVKDVVDQLNTRAQIFYDNYVAPVENQLKAIPSEMSKSELEQKQRELQKARDELERLTVLEKQAYQEMVAHINSLMNSRCNLLAINELKNYNNSTLRYSIIVLQDYAGYCSGLKAPLENLKTALENNSWNRLDANSAALQQFDLEWESVPYLSYINSMGNDGIPFLNDCVKKVVSLRLRGFGNCQTDFDQLLENLTPYSVSVDSRYSEIVNVNQQITETNRIIEELQNDLSTENSNNEMFNKLDKERYEVVEKWYDIHEAKDKVILDACRYCLSNPIDELGNYQWMCSQVKPLLNNVFHKSYKARRDIYITLLADYEQHSNELAGFLKRVAPFATTAGGVSAEEKAELLTSLRSLDYYKTYYVGRKDPKAVSSPHLDGIISEFERLLEKDFVDSKGQYTTLVSEVKADCPSLSDMTHLETLSKNVEKWMFESFLVKGVLFKMIRVAGDTFTLSVTNREGYNFELDKGYSHSVTLNDYYIGQTEVTQELWEAVMGSNPSRFKGAKRPVENVSWNDCMEFIRILNKLTGKNFRLPTQSEWEYAARGGIKTHGYYYSGSNEIADVAWYGVNSYSKGLHNPDYGTHFVASKHPNELGLFDMSGNVSEWCQDWYGVNVHSFTLSSSEQSSSYGRVCRGGGWCSNAKSCSISNGDWYYAYQRQDFLGFRLAFDFTPLDSINYAKLKETLILNSNLQLADGTELPRYAAATMPSFPGGSGALVRYISKNVRYPQSAQDNKIQGKVVVQFVIEKDGRVGEIKIIRSVCDALDNEAKRVCKSLPKFYPAKNANGDPVRVWFTLPFPFLLQGVN